VSRECRIGGKPLSLRRREFDILELLLRNENQVFTRENLISSVWRKEYSGSSNVVDVHVKYLRDKLRPFGCDTLVVTVRGVGYKMNCPEYS
jgi:two-component system copper resistance phosphate regulon response regulator CusR